MSEKDDRLFMEAHRNISDDDMDALCDDDCARLYLLFVTRPAATQLGFWRDCPMPACRRAKACRGRFRAEEHNSFREATLPPCALRRPDGWRAVDDYCSALVRAVEAEGFGNTSEDQPGR